MKRHCENCIHREKDECHHPQAIHMWGRLTGMQNVLPDKGWPRWPKVTGWCGFWKPDQEWLDKAEKAA